MRPISELQDHALALSEEAFVSNYPEPSLILAPGRSPLVGAEQSSTTRPGRQPPLDKAQLSDWLSKTCHDEGIPAAFRDPFDMGLTPVQPHDLEARGLTDVVFVAKGVGTQNPFSHMISVGRLLHNDIVLPYSAVSKVHAVFLVSGENFAIMDQTSTNGTWLEAERLTPGEKRTLVDGSWLSFGTSLGAKFLFPETLYRFLRGPEVSG